MHISKNRIFGERLQAFSGQSFTRTITFVFGIFFGCAITSVSAIELSASPQMQRLTDSLIAKKIYTREELLALLGPIEIDQSVLKLFKRQAEAKPWHEYRNIFLKKKRIEDGKSFMLMHQDLLARVDEKYGVPPEIVTALIGVETFYGTRMGSRSVLRSLVTLAAAYPRRAKFFAKELETFLGLLKTESLVASGVEGSYAGAIGIPQFMPTSYLAYAVDFNDNGKRDLVNEFEDAAGSVANYLVVHGWRRSAPIAQWIEDPVSDAAQNLVAKRAKPKLRADALRKAGVNINAADDTKVSINRLKEKGGTKYFIGYANFYAITRYNPSNKYAMAIVELAQAIKGS